MESGENIGVKDQKVLSNMYFIKDEELSETYIES